jgi:hypothetical protein
MADMECVSTSALGTVIRGHLRYEIVRECIPADCIRLVFLRDPMQRTLSHLHHIKRHPEQNHFLESVCPIRSMSVDELLEDDNVRNYLTNFQAKKIALPRESDSISGDVVNLMFSKECSTNRDILYSALENLSEFDFIGISEFFEESVKRLQKVLGCYKQFIMPCLNARPDAQVPSTREENDLKRKIDKITELDQELYIHFREQFIQ